MSDTLSPTNYIQGLWLGRDRRQANALRILDGRDFIVDFEGPRDFFSRNLLCYDKLTNCQGARTVRIDGQTYILSGDSLLRYDSTAGTFVPQFIFEPNGEEDAHPWSVAFIDGMYYFARKGNHVHEYIPASNTWRILDGEDDPVDPYAVAVAGGRLIVLAEAAVYWSEVGNAVFTTDVDTGAGLQLLAAVGAGTPVALLETQDGFIAYTTRGAALFTVIDSAIPFAFRPIVANSDLNDILAPINPYAVVATGPATHVMLTAAGLVQISGADVTQFDEEASAFLRNNFIRFLPNANRNFARLWYSAAEGLFGVSLSTSLRSYEYDYALVRSMYTNQWSKFSAGHLAVDEFALNLPSGSFYNAGFIDLDGYVWYFSGQPQNEVLPDISAYLQQFGDIVIPNKEFTVVDGSQTRVRVSEYIRLTTENVGSLPAEAGLYTTGLVQLVAYTPGVYSVTSYLANSSDEDWLTLDYDVDWLAVEGDEDWLALDGVSHARDVMTLSDGVSALTTTRASAVFEPTYSWIEYGPYRLTDQQTPYRFTVTKDIALEVAESASPTIDEDWRTLAGEEDWLTSTAPDEDWGADSTGPMQFAFDTFGTLDAENVFATNSKTDLEELLGQSNSRRYFANLTGRYHIFRVRADEVGHSYHIKVQETSAELGGVIS